MKVVVTGLGVVSSIGNDIESFWSACLAGKSTVEATPFHWNHYYSATSKVWAPLHLPAFLELGFRRSDLLVNDVVALIAMVAADEAISSAGLNKILHDPRANTYRISGIDRNNTGVFIGTGLGGAKAPFDNYLTHLLTNLKSNLKELANHSEADALAHELVTALQRSPRVNPMVICQTMPNAISSLLGIRYGFRGTNETVCFACASGTAAIGSAYRAIASGELELAIAGGVEHLSDRAGGVFMGFDRLQTLAKPRDELGTENRPFDAARSGFLFSEGGAAIVVLESRDHAERRGAKALAEIKGFAINSDAHSIAAISTSDNAIREMIFSALNKAKLRPTDIGYINAHGTATEINDAIEAPILEEIFGNRPLINSTKSLLGHTIGASGAFEFVVSTLSLVHQKVHGTRNLTNPIADLNLVKSTTNHEFDYALTHSFGFGGHNAGLILGTANQMT